MDAESHRYEFARKDALTLTLIPFVLPVLFALAMHFGARFALLPPPFPALDADRVILLHQATPNATSRTADLVLIGDSSCMMNVSAVQLDTATARSSVNLGTLSYLDLRASASILARHNAARPAPFRTVVLLMHPDALRIGGSSDYHAAVLRSYYAGTDYCQPLGARTLCLSGVEIFRGRILSRAIPRPLPGALGTTYGFTHDLRAFLAAHRGSAYDPGAFDPQTATGSTEYRLARSLESASRAFRASLPPGTKLLVGITPAPQSFVEEGFNQVQSQMIQTWGSWLNADGLLTNLPAALPDDLFASKTHLNKRGVELFTEQLGRELDRHLHPSIVRERKPAN